MRKITREEFIDFILAYRDAETSGKMQATRDGFWSRIQEAQSSEPMSRDEFLDAMDKALGQDRRLFTEEELDAVCALTVKQGFVPDWSKAQYDGVKGVTWQYVYQTEEEMGHELGAGYDGYIPRPAPKIRQKTTDELVRAVQEWMVKKIIDGESIEPFCRAAGIPLETSE